MTQPFFIVNVEAAIYKNDQWLMCIRSQQESHAAGTLSMVGGKVDHSDSKEDSLEEALKREVFEEVGILIDDLVYLQSSSFVSKKGNHVVDVVFVCRYKDGKPEIKSFDEIAEVKWLTIAEIIEHPSTPSWTTKSLGKAEQFRKRSES